LFSDRVSNLITFYNILSQLAERHGGLRTLAAVETNQVWPARGIYFFFEPGEVRTVSGEGDRVVRVASHSFGVNSPSAFWGGLLGTRGGPSGKGNHRASIFRQLIGEALLRRSGRSLPSWGVGSSQRDTARKLGLDLAAVAEAEGAVEIEVSGYIRQMPFTWMSAPPGPSPDSRRAYYERQAIALLSNATGQADPPSPTWLGRLSSRERVRASGLWNSNHVQRQYSDKFLAVLEAAADREATRRPRR
jgi:hypothetical protein